MAIARVRIAPIERWCEPLKRAIEKGFGAEQAVGLIVGIDTASMAQESINGCGGREWVAVEIPEGYAPRTLDGQLAKRLKLCEHILEMD